MKSVTENGGAVSPHPKRKEKHKTQGVNTGHRLRASGKHFPRDIRWGRHLGCCWPIQSQWGTSPEETSSGLKSEPSVCRPSKLGSKGTSHLPHIGICKVTAWSWILWSRASWSKLPSLRIGISAAGITKGSLKRKNSPSSRVMPFTSICSPADVAAWAAWPDWKVRPAIMQATHTRWSLSQSGHMGYGTSPEGQASQNPVVGYPQATHGCWRDLVGLEADLVAQAYAAQASLSHSRRPRVSANGSHWGLAAFHESHFCFSTRQSAATTAGMASGDATRSKSHWRGTKLSLLERSFLNPRLTTPPFCTHLSKRNKLLLQNKKLTQHQNTNSNTMISPVFWLVAPTFFLVSDDLPPKKKIPTKTARLPRSSRPQSCPLTSQKCHFNDPSCGLKGIPIQSINIGYPWIYGFMDMYK